MFLDKVKEMNKERKVEKHETTKKSAVIFFIIAVGIFGALALSDFSLINTITLGSLK